MELKNRYYFKEIAFGDYADVVQLVNSAYRGDSSLQGWTTEAEYLDGQRTDLQTLKEELKNPNKTILCLRAQDDPEIIGTVLLEKIENEKGLGFYLGMLTIKPLSQNAGLGKWMMSEAETYAKRLGATRMSLGVLSPRHELMSWYERRGYRKTGLREDFPYGDERFGRPKIKDLHFVMFEKTI